MYKLLKIDLKQKIKELRKYNHNFLLLSCRDRAEKAVERTKIKK